MAEVTYDNATCIYPGAERPAVDGLELAVRDGEFVVMVGPSGCGKTTALRMLAGLEEIDGGAIRIDGKDMTGVPSRDRDIAMVFQNYALYPSKTVAENMGFALKMQGVAKDERARRVGEAAKLLDLEQLLDRKRGTCPAGSGSGWPWAAPSSASPRSSAWTSRCPTWTRSSGCRPAPRSPSCSGDCR
jgi:multiple sugar transport system ATP-binding protein